MSNVPAGAFYRSSFAESSVSPPNSGTIRFDDGPTNYTCHIYNAKGSSPPIKARRHTFEGFGTVRFHQLERGFPQGHPHFNSTERGTVVGSGAQGTITICHDKVTKEVYVVKELAFEKHEEALAAYEHAHRLFSRIKHGKLIRYQGGELGLQWVGEAAERQSDEGWSSAEFTHSFVLQADCYFVLIVLPYYEEGDMASLFALEKFPEVFTPALVASIALQLAEALRFLHKASIVHGDVKPQNILFFNNRTQCVLMDLDTSFDENAADIVNHSAVPLNAQNGPQQSFSRIVISALTFKWLFGGRYQPERVPAPAPSAASSSVAMSEQDSSPTSVASQSSRAASSFVDISEPARHNYTFEWSAPETVSTSGEVVTSKSDMFSFGMVLLSLLSRSDCSMIPNARKRGEAFTNNGTADWRSQEELSASVCSLFDRHIPKGLERVYAPFRKVVLGCLNFDPKARMGSEEARELLVETCNNTVLGV